MASFSVTKHNYGYYFNHTSTPFNNIILHKFIKSLLIIIFFAIILFFICNIFDFVYGHHNQWYINHHFYYYIDIMQSIFQIIFAMSIIIMVSNTIIHFNFFYQIIENKKNFKAIYFLITWFLLSYISFIIFILYRDKLININIFTQYQTIIYKEYYNIFYVFWYNILPFIVPLAIFLIMYSIFSKLGNNDQDIEIQGVIELNSLDEHLLNGNDGSLSVIQENIDNGIVIMYIIAFYISFFISWCTLFLFTSLDLSFLTDYFEYIIWIFLIVTSLFRKLLKKLAKDIDHFRHINNVKYGHNDNYISLDYLMEGYASLYYYSFTKQYVAFNISISNRSLFLFIFISISHFLTETIETNIMFTQIYFNKSLKIINFYKENKSLKMLYNVFCDDSNLYQWRARLSMDIFVRFYGSILLSLYYLAFFILYGQEFLDTNYGKNFYKTGILLTLIYSIQDILHYIITIIIVHKYFKFNMLGQFINYFIKMGYNQLIVFIIVNVSLLAVVFAANYLGAPN